MREPSVRPDSAYLPDIHAYHYRLTDLDAIKDPLELAASVGIIHNCKSDSLVYAYFRPTFSSPSPVGQTPRKIFSSPHPPRYMEGELSLPLGSLYGIPEHAHLLIQSSKPFKSE
jgi:hypothetical protein